jgi:hypothetical protein
MLPLLWISRVKQEFERLSTGDIWENERNYDKIVWIRVSKRCVGTERERERETTNIVQQGATVRRRYMQNYVHGNSGEG